MNNNTPAAAGFYFPAEWHKHEATWLSWPHKEASWPGKIDTIYAPYCQFIGCLTQGEIVRINVANQAMEAAARLHLQVAGVNLNKVEFFHFPTNDAWCRDHGPAFLLHNQRAEKAVVDWGYNAWGNKYPPYDLDDVIPTKIARHYGYPLFEPGIVMEGGSVEFNGNGTILTSVSCLLNANRNPQLSKTDIEQYLCEFYGQQQVLWVDDGIVGDDTDGHIDDTVRFVNEDTVITVVETNKRDDNYALLQQNFKQLQNMRLWNGKQLNIIELPMPDEIVYEDQRLPASYANYYISNLHVIVPTFRSVKDEIALRIVQQAYPDRTVIGIDSTDIIWGLGSFHCLSQQEPAIMIGS